MPDDLTPIIVAAIAALGGYLASRANKGGQKKEQALKEAIHVLEARLAKYKIENRKDPRFGAFTRDEWLATEDFFFNVGLIKTKPDIASLVETKYVAGK